MIPARPVTMHELLVTDVRRDGPWLDVDISVRCSSGTYIRAIARDLGAALGVGGHLTALRRTAVGPFVLDDARTLDQLADDFVLLDISEVARRCFPSVDLDADGSARRVGRPQAGARPRRVRSGRGVRARRGVPRALRAARRNGGPGRRVHRLSPRRFAPASCRGGDSGYGAPASFSQQLADAARSMQGCASTQQTLDKVVLVATEIIHGCDLVGISVVHRRDRHPGGERRGAEPDRRAPVQAQGGAVLRRAPQPRDGVRAATWRRTRAGRAGARWSRRRSASSAS